MSLFRKKNTPAADTTKRVVMLSSEIPDWGAQSDEFTTDDTVNFNSVAQNLKAREPRDNGTGAIDSPEDEVFSDSIPDVLRQAHSINHQMVKEKNHEVIGQWLGMVCSLLLAPREDVQVLTLPLDTQKGSLFMRAVSKNLLNRLPAGTFRSITLFVYRGTDVYTPWVPVAFAVNHAQNYAGLQGILPVGIFPAAEIASPLACSDPWYIKKTGEDKTSDGQDATARTRSYYTFANPIETLCHSAFLAEGCGLKAALLSVCETNHTLAPILTPYIEKLPDSPGIIANPVILRKDIFPGVNQEQQEQDQRAKELETYLTDTLCLIEREKIETGEGDNAALKNAYFLSVRTSSPHAREGEGIWDAVLPLSLTFAAYLNELKDADYENLLASFKSTMFLEEHTYKGLQTYTLTWTFDGTTIVKLYKPGHYTDMSDANYFPLLALWPCAKFITSNQVNSASSNDWRHYYVYSKNFSTGKQNVVINAYPKDSTKGDQIVRKEGRVEHVDHFPNILAVEENNKEVGLLLIKPDNKRMQMSGATSIIAVDFGTSNTVAYQKDPLDNSMPNALTLPSYLLPITAGNEEVQERDYSIDFLSSDDFMDSVFVSMLHVPEYESAFQGTSTIVGSVIPFARALVTVDEKLINRLWFDLKWHDIQNVAQYSRTNAFLAQLIQMYAFEAKLKGYSYICWRFSWPRAMSVGDYDNFKKNITGLVNEYSALPHSISFFSEADAVGDYITAPQTTAQIQNNGWKPVVQNYGFTCIDIGGGSVDISIWQDNNLCAEASLRDIAGDMVLLESIVHNTVNLPVRRQLLEDVYSNPALDRSEINLGRNLISLLDHNDKEGFKKKWTLNIDGIARAFHKRLPEATVGILDSMVCYHNMLEIYLSAIVYFTGLLTQKAIGEERMKAGFKESFSLFFLGNGSQLIRFLRDGQNPNFRSTRLYDNLVVLFTFGLDAEEFPQIISPLEPKREVAFGMAARPLSQQEIDAQKNWNSGQAESASLDRLRQLRSGSPIDMKVDKKLDWANEPDYEKRKTELIKLWDGFWEGMSRVHGPNFDELVSRLYNINVLGEGAGLKGIKEYTKNFVNTLSNDNIAEERKDMNTMFAYILRQIIINARG